MWCRPFGSQAVPVGAISRGRVKEPDRNVWEEQDKHFFLKPMVRAAVRRRKSSLNGKEQTWLTFRRSLQLVLAGLNKMRREEQCTARAC